MKHCNLMLHCGASAVDRGVLETVPTPMATDTWQPIPHFGLLCQVETALERSGFGVVDEAHGLTHDARRYFGLIQVQNGHQNPDYSWVLGVRNSHDKRFPAGLVAGNSVFVCDNLAFLGELQVTRKHTVHIMRDLPILIDATMASLVGQWRTQDKRVEAYKNTRMNDRRAHDLVIQAMDRRAINVTQIPNILQEWREPKHLEFRPRSLWSWFNAVTENLKGALHLLPRRTEALHEVCDACAGLRP
jgi:hypothetical protein